MSARSMARARERELNREERRRSRVAKRAATGAAIALGAGIAFAPGAQAANFTVTSNNDGPADACDANCTLRDAVEAADADATGDNISFAPTVTGEIQIDPGEGVIEIDSAMTIQGPGAGTLAIDGQDASELFDVETDDVGAPNDQVNISGLTLRNGNGSSGVALYSTESATTLDAVVVSGNTTGDQGAVYGEGGSLTVTNSTFRSNRAYSGGAIYTDDDDPANGDSALVIRNSTFVGNLATGVDGNGGALYVDDETDSALIAGSTFNNNSAVDDGGAILWYGTENGAGRIENSTISGNSAGRSGGAIYLYGQYDKPVDIVDSTIAGNTAGLNGGGLYNYAFDEAADPGVDTFNVSSTIVAGNDAPSGPDLSNRTDSASNPISGVNNVGFSLIGDTAGAAFVDQPAGSNILNADPQLGALANNGGPTRTMLPAETSPVVDAGIANGLTTDQRGLPRTVKRSFELPAGGDGTDIGAVELQDDGLTGVTIKAKKNQKATARKIVVVVEAGADEDVQAVASGTIKAGKGKPAKLKKASKTIAGGKLAKLKLTPKSKKDAKKIGKVIDAGKKAKAKLKVTLTDPAGNKKTKKPKVNLKK